MQPAGGFRRRGAVRIVQNVRARQQENPFSETHAHQGAAGNKRRRRSSSRGLLPTGKIGNPQRIHRRVIRHINKTGTSQRRSTTRQISKRRRRPQRTATHKATQRQTTMHRLIQLAISENNIMVPEERHVTRERIIIVNPVPQRERTRRRRIRRPRPDSLRDRPRRKRRTSRRINRIHNRVARTRLSHRQEKPFGRGQGDTKIRVRHKPAARHGSTRVIPVNIQAVGVREIPPQSGLRRGRSRIETEELAERRRSTTEPTVKRPPR